MTLPAYGVLIGTLNRFAREDPNDFGSWYHGKLYVQAPAGEYECAVDVSTPSGVGVEYRVAHNLSSGLFASVLARPPGWHLVPRVPLSGALDYVRSPLLLPSVRHLPSWLLELLRRWFGWYPPQPPWISSTGDNALSELEAQLIGCRRVFVFGAPYTSGRGVHDIHMNQGDPPGPFQHLDGIWQDGGTVIERPNGELVAMLIKFATQSLRTDENGLPR